MRLLKVIDLFIEQSKNVRNRETQRHSKLVHDSADPHVAWRDNLGWYICEFNCQGSSVPSHCVMLS